MAAVNALYRLGVKFVQRISALIHILFCLYLNHFVSPGFLLAKDCNRTFWLHVYQWHTKFTSIYTEIDLKFGNVEDLQNFNQTKILENKKAWFHVMKWIKNGCPGIILTLSDNGGVMCCWEVVQEVLINEGSVYDFFLTTWMQVRVRLWP